MAAPAPRPAAVASAAPWGWPLSARPPVLARFALPAGPYAAGHRGVDLAAAPGEPVLSPAAGTVSFAGAVAGRPVLVVTHADGLRSTLEPVRAILPVGTPVTRGTVVGAVTPQPGQPGHCGPRTCVHWGVLRGTLYLDPLRLLAVRPTVLLPLRG